MFAALVNISLKTRLLVVMIVAGIMVYGGYALRDLPIDVLPDLNKGLVTILTEAPGFAPEEVETLVTYPIETAMNGGSGVTRVRSVSSNGLSIVYVEFDWDTDLYANRQIVAERLAPLQGSLPQGLEPMLAPISSYMGEVMLVALSSTTLSPMELRELADWVVAPRVKAVPGVSRVVPIGGLVREYRVTVDNFRMSQLEITIGELVQAFQAYGRNSGGGVVNRGAQEFLIRSLSRTQSLDDIRNLAVAYRNGQTILLRQVADVSFEPKQRRGDAGFMGEPAVIISIQKQPQADTVVLTEEIEKVLAELQRTVPEGTRVNEFLFRQANFIHASVGNLKQVLMEAGVVVSVILFLFLLNVRTTVISLLAIPVSVLTTFVVFRWLGLTINTMTLGGLAIAIGELVDDAVVDVENIYRRLRENRQIPKPRPALSVIADASQEVRSSIVYSTAIIVLVFAPLFALPGIEGRLFAPLGIAYIVSILASLVTSITLTPVLCSYFLPKMKSLAAHETPLVRWLKAGNSRLVVWVLRRPTPVLASVTLAVIIAGLVVPTLPRSFLPPFNEGTLVVTMTLEPGISLEESSRIAAAAEHLILAVPEVVNVGRRTGRSEADEHALGVNVSEIEVGLDRSDRTLDAVVADVRARLATLPGTVSIGQPISHRLIDHILTGVAAEVVIKIYGDDLDVLRSTARRVEAWLKGVPGLTDVSVERQVPVPQIQISVDPTKALLYGLQPGEVGQRLATLTNGQKLEEIVDGIRRFDIMLRLGDDHRGAPALESMLIETPSGHIPVSMIATITETTGPNEILRENNQRRIIVMANGDGSNNNRITGEIAEMMKATPLEPGYYMEFEGIYAEQAGASVRLAGMGVISLLLVFAILYGRYRSAIISGMIMANVPLALIGSVIALKITGLELSVASIVGFITLTGISTRNGILKISHYLNLMAHEGEAFGESLIIRGANERLVPVLMTATSAMVALIPLMIGADQAGKEILHPVAVVIFGGLISATALDMLLTPLLFHRFAPLVLDRVLSGVKAGAMKEAY